MARPSFGSIEAFLAVAEHGSLRRAAEALGVQPPAISYQLKVLEEQVGTELFFRTTRSVQLTDAGRMLLARARPAMEELDEALEDTRRSVGAASGAVRVTLPYVAYDLTIGRRLRAFQERYPQIELELSFNEAFVDIAAEGFHAGVRLGDHVRDDMIAVRLTEPFREAVFAAPAYLDAHGRPQRPQDLLRHNCIRYRFIASRRFADWQFAGKKGTTTVDVRGSLIVNSTSALLDAARKGLGLGWLFRPSIEADVAEGCLECVLEDHAVERPGYFLYYPRASTRRHAFRLFADFMKAA